MSTLKISGCMKIVAKLGDEETTALLDRLEQYQNDGVPLTEAQRMAAADTLAELRAERDEFMGLAREQHGDAFKAETTPNGSQQFANAMAQLREAKTAFDAFDRKTGLTPQEGETYFTLARKLSDARQAWAEQAAKLEPFGFEGRTKDGRPIYVTPSAQQPGMYQLTRYGSDGLPWGDSQYRTAAQALEDFSFEAELDSMKWAGDSGVQFSPIDQPELFTAPPFYSALSKQVQGANMRKASASAWKDWLKGQVNNGAVKADEIAWSGLVEWLDLQEGNVRREDVQAFLDQNGVKLTETVYDDAEVSQLLAKENIDAMAKVGIDMGMRDSKLTFYSMKTDEEVEPEDFNATQARAWAKIKKEYTRPTVYSDYKIPGGKNYREMLLQLPEKQKDKKPGKLDDLPGRAERMAETVDVQDRLRALREPRRGDETAAQYDARYNSDEANALWARLQKLREQNLTEARAHEQRVSDWYAGQGINTYRSGHWQDAPNPVAHVRFDERTDEQGRRVLFINEIQSDWAQTGRESGFREPVPPAEMEAAVKAREDAGTAFNEAAHAVRLQSTRLSELRNKEDRLADEAERHPVPARREEARAAIQELAKLQEREREKMLEISARFDEARQARQQAEETLTDLKVRQGAESRKPPKAPFVDSTEKWTALVLKRMAKYAVDNGFDRVAIANGEQISDALDMSAHLEAVEYDYRGQWLRGYPRNSGRPEIEESVPLDQLQNYVGHDVANKIRNEVEQRTREEKQWDIVKDNDAPEGVDRWFITGPYGDPIYDSGGDLVTFDSEAEALEGIEREIDAQNGGESVVRLDGLDLKVGNEGNKAFYDKIVPNVLKSVLKRVGGKPTTVRIDMSDDAAGPWGVWLPDVEGFHNKTFTRRAEAEGFANNIGGEVRALPTEWGDQVGFDITPEMRDAIDGGMPLFSPIDQPTPVPLEPNVPNVQTRPDLGADIKAAQVAVFGAKDTRDLRTRARDSARGFFAGLRERLVQGLVDQFAPLKKLSMKAYMLARMSVAGDGTFEAMMLYGKPFINEEGVADVKLGEGGFGHVLADLQGEHQLFLQWVAAKRAEELMAKGKENLFTPADIEALQKLNEGTMPDGRSRAEVYDQALRKLNEYNDAVLKIGVDSGLIGPWLQKAFKDHPYVPFLRELDEGPASPKYSSSLTGQEAWRPLKGGTTVLHGDLLENVLRNWSHVITASAKNRAAVESLREMTALGIAEPAEIREKGSVRVMEGGVPAYYHINDPAMAEAVSSMHYAMPGFMKPVADFKRILTMGVTTLPPFKLRNLVRDSIQSLGLGDLSPNVLGNVSQGLKTAGFNQAVKNLGATIAGRVPKDFTAQNQTFASMLAAGGLIRFHSSAEGDRSKHVTNIIRRATGKGVLLDQNSAQRLMNYMKDVLEAYHELGDTSEQVNRIALYEQLRAKGHGHAEAAFMARDLMDFSMQGKAPVVRFLVQTVPFLNARLQGLYKLGRAGIDNPQRMAAVTGAVVLGSMALMLAQEDDPDWKAREDWDRDSYWWFKIGNTVFRLPKPFEVGAIGTLAERTWELGFDKDMTGRRYRERLANMFMQTFSFNPLPQLVKPLVDVYANKDSFTGRDIESAGMERLLPAQRYNENTSILAREAGDLLGVSPLKLDFLIRGYLGTVGTLATSTMDLALRPLTGAPETPTLRLSAYTAGFLDELPSNQSRYVQNLYDRAEQVGEVYASIQRALQQGDLAKARELREAYPGAEGQAKASEAIKREMGKLNAEIQRVAASTMLNAEAKRAKLDELNQKRNAMAERFAERLPAY